MVVAGSSQLRYPAQKTANKKGKIMGSYNTLSGNIPDEQARRALDGDGNTIVGSTDNNGNTRTQSTTAIGLHAYAANGTIAIGAYANAGADYSQRIRDNDTKILSLLSEIRDRINELDSKSSEFSDILETIRKYYETEKLEDKKNLLQQIIFIYQKNIPVFSQTAGVASLIIKIVEMFS